MIYIYVEGWGSTGSTSACVFAYGGAGALCLSVVYILAAESQRQRQLHTSQEVSLCEKRHRTTEPES